MSNLEFKYPLNIIYILIPILSFVFLILGYRKKEKILNMLKINVSMKFKVLRSVLLSAGLLLIVFSLLGPQSFIGYTEVKKEGLDIYFLVDTSKSMLVEDIKPSRISRAKNIIENVIDKLEGDRIGLIPFSSAAYIQMPLTDDYQLARMFLNVIDTDMIGGGGTNVSTAIKLAHNSFDTTTSSADRVVIVLSDGEEHDNNSIEALKLVSDDKLKVYTIGIGTDKGGLVPVFDTKGENRIGYKEDGNGQFVMSRLNSETLKGLASSGKGQYYQSTISGEEINSLVSDIAALKRDAYKTDKIQRFKQLYQYFLGLGILMILIVYLLSERRRINE